MSPERIEYEKQKPDMTQDRTSLQDVPNVVPACPAGLAFQKQDFLLADFTVDGFLSHTMSSGNDVGLERLRDDLGLYLKVLRAAMIELINEDYADFVNLSTNLVGLDKTISTLEEPLKLYVSRVEAVKASITENHQKLTSKLELKEQLYQKRVALQNLQHITNTLNKIERLLNINRTKDVQFDDKDDNLNADMVERIAADIHHLNYCMQVCKADAFVRETQPRLKLIGYRLQQAMERQLLEAILTGQEKQESLRRCLRIYATVDRVADAEELVRKKIVAPYLEEVISEKSLHSDPQGLKGVFQRVMKLITDNLKPLIVLTQPNLSVVDSATNGSLSSGGIHHTGGHHVLKDFDFLVRSMWPEVVEKFEDNLSFLFSAGNPDRFHTNFTQSMEFLNEFEKNLVFLEDVEKFRQGNAYNNFVGRWSLAVYYQIRFREIALPVEISMDTEEFLNFISEIDHLIGSNDSGTINNKFNFRLASTYNILLALEKCWSPAIFLPAILHRFWKLTLQVMSRYNTAVECVRLDICKDCHSTNNESGTVVENTLIKKTLPHSGCDDQSLSMNINTSGMSSISTLKGHARSSSDQKASIDLAATDSEENRQKVEKRKELLVLVFLDIIDLCNAIRGPFFTDTVLPIVSDLDEAMIENLRSSLIEGSDLILQQRQGLTDDIVKNISSKSIPHLKSVNDIQRLYRRTNRQVPSKPCPYIVSVLLPLQEFHTSASAICPKDIVHNWSIEILSNVTTEYLGVVSETLAAVQKMEESLRRLKKVREKTTGGAGDKLQEGAASTKISDDDKIRLQLYVDVKHFIQQIEKGLKVESKEVESLTKIENLVIDATKTCFDDYISKISEISSQ